MPFSGKTRQAAEFFQTFYHICPPEAKRGQNIHFLAVTSRCRNLTFKKWSVLKLGQCQNTNKIRVMRLVVGKDSVRFRPSPLIFQISNKNMVRARGLEPPTLSGPDPKSGASAIPPRAQPSLPTI